MRLPGRSPDARVELPFIPGSVPSGSRSDRHRRTGNTFLLTGFEPGSSSLGIGCMTADLLEGGGGGAKYDGVFVLGRAQICGDLVLLRGNEGTVWQ